MKRTLKLGTCRSEYDIIPRGFAKMTLLEPNAFKVIYAESLTVGQWNEHFTSFMAKKRGVVVAKVLDKTTKDIYVDIDGNEFVYIFQVVKQKGKVKIPAILNSTLDIIQGTKLIL